MFNCEEEEKCVNENDFSSIIGMSLRNVISNSLTDLVLPYRLLSISHISSWNAFENDLIQILKRTSRDFLLVNHLDFHQNDRNEKQKKANDDEKYFQCLMNSDIVLIPIKSDFDRLHHLMYNS